MGMKDRPGGRSFCVLQKNIAATEVTAIIPHKRKIIKLNFNH